METKQSLLSKVHSLRTAGCLRSKLVRLSRRTGYLKKLWFRRNRRTKNFWYFWLQKYKYKDFKTIFFKKYKAAGGLTELQMSEEHKICMTVKSDVCYTKNTFTHTFMEHSELQKRVEQFLNEIGVPGFIIFGHMEQKPNVEAANQQLHIVSSFKDMPTNAAVKGLTRVVSDFANRAL